MFLHATIAGIELVECLLNLVGQEVGEETQSASVHADDRNARRPNVAGGLQQRAIATHRDGVVNGEVQHVEHMHAVAKRSHNGLAAVHLPQEVVERALYENLCLVLLQTAQQLCC